VSFALLLEIESGSSSVASWLTLLTGLSAGSLSLEYLSCVSPLAARALVSVMDVVVTVLISYDLETRWPENDDAGANEEGEDGAAGEELARAGELGSCCNCDG